MTDKAFTLAEVLITLGIIGVVATLTLPNLIEKHQKKVAVTQLKKAYTILKQATEFAKLEHGEVNDWDFTLTSDEFGQKYYKPYLNVIVDSKVLHHKFRDLKNIDHGSTKPTLVLSDGTYIYLYFGTFQAKFFMVVDLNGHKKPNRVGRDVFAFTFYNNGLNTYEQYGTTKDRSYVTGPWTSGQCNFNASGGLLGPGSYCSRLIELDGWEIKDDYPW